MPELPGVACNKCGKYTVELLVNAGVNLETGVLESTNIPPTSFRWICQCSNCSTVSPSYLEPWLPIEWWGIHPQGGEFSAIEEGDSYIKEMVPPTKDGNWMYPKYSHLRIICVANE